MRKTLLIILSCSLITACAYHRFESIATCEFESRDFLTMEFWRSSNCLGIKEDDSHAKKAIDEVKKIDDE